ncbi:hypothetical protein FGO68_gene4542 [Halteria grandinella]|uniref:Uncharacterized protein n=1 Tax=Halteria grandinella TaxID=5974 RepID=A0A8J8N9S5_HALGN|nr:hypothetical protein FGO68_gene4542 [Halteria grandinella]
MSVTTQKQQWRLNYFQTMNFVDIKDRIQFIARSLWPQTFQMIRSRGYQVAASAHVYNLLRHVQSGNATIRRQPSEVLQKYHRQEIDRLSKGHILTSILHKSIVFNPPGETHRNWYLDDFVENVELRGNSD